MQRAKRILALVLAFTLVASFCVTGAAADFYAEIYSDEALGIEITASRSYDATNPSTVSFTVVVDGEPKVSNREIIMPRANVSFDVEADGYDVSYDCNGAYIDAGVMTVNQDNASVTVNLTSERDSAEYVIQNASTNYGTFWWIKHNAGTSAFSRTVSIYVNGDWQYNQTVWTPTELTNGGAGDQYGFRPNQELYNVEATLSPPISLDQVANRNVSVYLTTKCPCGQSSCTCPGGSECTCSEGCTCEECVPELGDNQIDTGYGIVTYRDDGESWGIFYKLTVRVTVNGEQVFESEQFRINGSAGGNLEFNVKSGYELPLDNYYTIDAYSGGASWAPIGGKLTFAGALSDDTKYDNVLTIHLYTSGNTAELDVERRPGVSEYMTGYIISYTLDGQEYTHEVDDFLAAQVPSIPLGTDVTISAICEAPYEVSEWHHDYHSGEMTISGSEGQSGTNAYGNEITLRLNSTAIPRYELYVEGVREVRVPTQTELENPETGLLRENAVTIDCVNSGEEHDSKTFGLISGTYSIGPLAGNSADGYTCTLTVTNAQPYVDEYNKTESGHELVAGQGNKTITLKYVAGEWTVPTDAAPVTYNVSCDNGGGEEPENPPKPGDDEIPGILGTEFHVNVVCETSSEHSVSYPVVANDTDNTRYNVSSVTENAAGGYSCTVTFTNIYLNTYIANNAGHNDSDTPDDTTVRLVWDAAEEAWELDPADNTATFYVKCGTGPDIDTEEQNVYVFVRVIGTDGEGGELTAEEQEQIEELGLSTTNAHGWYTVGVMAGVELPVAANVETGIDYFDEYGDAVVTSSAGVTTLKGPLAHQWGQNESFDETDKAINWNELMVDSGADEYTAHNNTELTIEDGVNYGVGNVACWHLNGTITLDNLLKQYVKVTYNANGGTGSMEDQAVPVGGSVTLSANEFEREGYSFRGWNTENDGGGTSYADEATIKNLTENLTLYAVWEEYQTINYHIVGDVQPEDNENWTDGNMSVKVEKGTEYSFAEAPEIAGYTFDGWYEKEADIGDEGKKEQSPITVGDKKYELYGSYSANTYRLTYDGNGGSFTNEWGTHTQTNENVTYAKQVQLYNTTYYFVREGYTCIGWSTDPDSTTAEFGGGAWVVFDDNTFPGLSSRGSVTLYAVWEKDEPTEEELTGPDGILADSVKLVCDRVGTHNCLFDLKPGTAEIGESVRGADGVLTCEVEVAVGEYLAEYNTKGQGTHILAAGEASEKTITLRFDEERESWVSATELPIIFNVHCQPEKPDGEDVAAALEGFKVWVECENDEAGHTYQRKDYTVAADDTGARYEIGEVTGDAENGYGCTVTIKPDVYVQRFGEMNGNTAHELTADSPRSFEIELVYIDTGWALAEGAPSSVTFYVECETETEPEGPEKPTVSDLNLGYVVRIECVNTENTHENDSVDFSLRTDTQISEPYLEDGSWKVTVTVNGGDYLDGYASDTWSGVEHELAPGETAEKTFEAVYGGTDWTVEATPAVTFRVVCDTTGDEGDEPAITGFSKRLVTSEPTWADFSRLGISYPDARDVIHVDRYDSVTLLYTLTVSGEEGAEYLINDPDAMLVTFRDGVASVREPATNMNGEFTDTVPSPHTYYVVKTFSWADIRDSGGYLSNTAIVEPMDGTGGPDGGDGESTETVKVEIDGDWYPVVKPGRPSALTDEHVAYMIGYADGTVRPLSGITRAEVATIFFRLLTDEVRDEYWSQSNPYTDVAEDAWYNNAISTLVNMGIISGYSDGTFRPDAAITRAEFTKIAVSFFDYADDGYSGRFSDVSGGSWYATFVDAAADMGLIEGYGDGTFRPDAGITRAEACAIVNRTLGRAPEAGHLLPRSEMNTWSDNANSNAWYYADVQEATNSHDYEWVTYGGERIENWTAKLAERDWADLEREWSDAHDAPGGEVMS